MNFLKALLIFSLFGFNSYSQVINQDSTKFDEELQLKNYFRLGFGITHNFFNIGGGIFFPVSERFLIGVRVNGDIETELFKIPGENFWNINASARYVPFIWNKGVILVGGGFGYAGGQKRGTLISRRVFITEEFEAIKFNSISTLTEIELGLFLTKSIGFFISGYHIYTTEKNVFGYQVGFSIFRLNSH